MSKKRYGGDRFIRKGLNRDIKDEFLVGISYMELKKASEAVSFFNKVIKTDQFSPHSLYKDEAEYYLALSYLKAGSYDKALELMNRIHNVPLISTTENLRKDLSAG